MEYLLWSESPVANACTLENVENLHRFDLPCGVPLQKEWPSDALARMSKSFKKATALTDDLVNSDSIKVCSKRLVDFLKRKKLKNAEYLPLIILDHKGKVASKEYSVVNLVGLQDALDHRASKPTFNLLDPNQIDDVENLIIDVERIDPTLMVFRLKGLFDPVLIEKRLADAILKEGFVGPFFEPLEDFNA